MSSQGRLDDADLVNRSKATHATFVNSIKKLNRDKFTPKDEAKEDQNVAGEANEVAGTESSNSLL